VAKIGVYSGTFDPIHLGHIAFAEATIAELKIDTLYLLAEENPRRKSGMADMKHRQAMLDLAAANNPKILTSLDGIASQHDVESIMSLLNNVHPGDKIVLLMGADVFLNIDKWPGFEVLINDVEFAVALRTEDDGEELVYKLQDIPGAKVTQIVTDRAVISSSKVRDQIAQGSEVKGLNSEVLRYATEHKLYKP